MEEKAGRITTTRQRNVFHNVDCASLNRALAIDNPTSFARCLGTLRSQHRNAQAERSVIDLARTSTDPDERADFFERGSGCRERGITIGTDWAEMGSARMPGQIRDSGIAGGV